MPRLKKRATHTNIRYCVKLFSVFFVLIICFFCVLLLSSRIKNFMLDNSNKTSEEEEYYIQKNKAVEYDRKDREYLDGIIKKN